MPSTYLTMVVIIALSLLVGRAVTLSCGRRKWSGLEPAVGFAVLMSVEGLLARLPEPKVTTIAGLFVMVGLSLWALRKPGLDWPRSAAFWISAAIAVVIVSIPFAVTGHWGLLGMGYNNDLGLHLAWAEWIRSGFGTEPSTGYPLGPHALSAVMSHLPGVELGPAFIGQTMAITVITVMTAFSAVAMLTSWRRVLAACLVGIPYLIASYYAQAAFKELAAALFLLAFTIALPQVTPLPDGRKEKFKALVPLILLLLGIVFTYSFPGLAWPFAVTIAWCLADPGFRAHLRPSRVWHFVSRPLVAVGILVGLGLVAALAFGPAGFGDAFSEVAGSDAFGPVSAIEAFGVWLTPDYRLAGLDSTPLPGLMGAISLLALLVALLWWRKQPLSVWPLAFIACVVLYVISLPWVGDYSLAKALTIASPIVMMVIIVALLSRPYEGWKPSQGVESASWIVLTAVFVLAAAASSLVVLRDASVSPPGHAAELTAFRKYIDGKSVLYADQDRFAPYYLNGASVGVPLAEFPDDRVIENEKKPFQNQYGQSVIDWDSFDQQTMQNFPYVVTTRAAWSSRVPPFYEEVAHTNSYTLWRRTGPAFGRPIMPENLMPAKQVNCQNAGGKYYTTQVDGTAAVFSKVRIGRREDWHPESDLAPGDSTEMVLPLTEGRWKLSIQYFSPNGFSLSAEGNEYGRNIPAAIDGQRLSNLENSSYGQYWAAGIIDIATDGDVTFTAKAKDPTILQKVTGYSRKTRLGRLVATLVGGQERVPLAKTCGRWVDFFRRDNAGQAAQPDQPTAGTSQADKEQAQPAPQG